MEPTRKRQRANTNGDSNPSPPTPPPTKEELDDYLLNLCSENHGAFAYDFLLDLACNDAAIARTIRQKHDAHQHHLRTRVFDFESSLENIDFDLHGPDGFYSDSEFKATADTVRGSIYHAIDLIGMEAGEEDISFGTRRNAMEALYKIAKIVCDMEELYESFQKDGGLEGTMVLVLGKMSEDEREQMCGVVHRKKTFLQRMEDLKKDARRRKTLREMGRAVKALRGEPEEEESECDVERHEPLFLGYDSDNTPITDARRRETGVRLVYPPGERDDIRTQVLSFDHVTQSLEAYFRCVFRDEPGYYPPEWKGLSFVGIVGASIQSIREEASKPDILLDTRHSAMMNLCEITSVIRRWKGIRDDFHQNGVLEGAMKDVLEHLSVAERRQLGGVKCWDVRDGETLLHRLQRLERAFRYAGSFPRLGRIIAMLCGEDPYWSEEESDDEVAEDEDIGSKEEVYESPDEEQKQRCTKRKRCELTQVTLGHYWPLEHPDE